MKILGRKEEVERDRSLRKCGKLFGSNSIGSQASDLFTELFPCDSFRTCFSNHLLDGVSPQKDHLLVEEVENLYSSAIGQGS
jgi:hypothetical protein